MAMSWNVINIDKPQDLARIIHYFRQTETIMAVLLMTCTLLAQVCCSLLQRFIPSGPAALFFNSKSANQNPLVEKLRFPPK